MLTLAKLKFSFGQYWSHTLFLLESFRLISFSNKAHTHTHTDLWPWAEILNVCEVILKMGGQWNSCGLSTVGSRAALVSPKSPGNRTAFVMDVCGTPRIRKPPICL